MLQANKIFTTIIKKINSLFTSLNLEKSQAPITEPLENITNSFKIMPSILSGDLSIDGVIISLGTVEIEGRIKGKIKAKLAVIREGGFVDGNIEADMVNIKGSFLGNVKAKNVNIFKKAKITGNIEYYLLAVEDGASIEGQFKRLAHIKATNPAHLVVVANDDGQDKQQNLSV